MAVMSEEQEKVTGWTIDMHLVVDNEGKVKVTQDLLDALRVKQGDMLSFHFDTTTNIVTVTGNKKPPDVHSEIQVKITPITSSMPTQLSVSPTLPRLGEVVTQPPLFDAGQPTPRSPTQRRTR